MNQTDEAIVFGERNGFPIPDWTLYRIEIRENKSGEVRKFLYIKARGCKHGEPASNHVVLAAYLDDGRVYDFAEQAYTAVTR